MNAQSYDAFVLLSFGGPEGPDDVMPFLRNVTRGRNVPEERLAEVAEHYHYFGGVSPINAQNRQLLEAVRAKFASEGLGLRLYAGNRNWHPFLTDTVAQMARDGVKRALGFATSAYSSYSGCRQYLEDIEVARHAVGDAAPTVDKLRAFFNHPKFVHAVAERVRDALRGVTVDRWSEVRFLFTAHSIPARMAETCAYESQLRETCSLVVEALRDTGEPNLQTSALLRDPSWQLVFQSRSGPASVPWLEPDVLDTLREMAATRPSAHAVIVPVGFLSDHMEVQFDLDVEAQALCAELGLSMTRVPTVGSHPTFVDMIYDLVQERMQPSRPRLALGALGASHDMCAPSCCAYSARPMAPAPTP